MSQARSRRNTAWYSQVVLGTLLAGGAVFFSAGRPWARATVSGAGVPDDALSISGNQAVPLVGALAVVIVTCALALLATRGRWRQAIALLVVLLGGVIIVQIILAAPAITDAGQLAVEASPSFTGSNRPNGFSSTPWRWVSLFCACCAVALGVLAVRLAPRWPTMGSRFDAPGSTTIDPEDEGDVWKALDAGRDPTE